MSIPILPCAEDRSDHSGDAYGIGDHNGEDWVTILALSRKTLGQVCKLTRFCGIVGVELGHEPCSNNHFD